MVFDPNNEMHFRLVLPSPRLMLSRLLRLPVIFPDIKGFEGKKMQLGKN